MSDEMKHELLLGALSLIGRAKHPDGFTITAQADDATWGNPQPVTRAITGLLRDGARIALDRWDNREAFLRVTITAATGDGLAAGEQALFAELGRRNTLTWTPPGGFAEPTVFDVEFSQLDHEFDSDDEAILGRRTYGIRFVCHPFARSVDPVITDPMSSPAPADGPTITVIDAGTSTTGWAASTGGTLSTTGTSVQVAWTSLLRDPPSGAYRITRTGSFAMSGDTYLRIEWSSYARQGYKWGGRQLLINGIVFNSADLVYEEVVSGNHFVSWLIAPATTITSIAIRGNLVSDGTVPPVGPGAPTGPLGRLEVYDIARADQIEISGASGHQLSRTITVHGSARTQASLHMWHDTNTLGDVLVHTSPTPNGMFSAEPYVTSTTTPGAGTMSGTIKDLTNPVGYRMPADLFDPMRASGYLLLGRMHRAGTGAITTTVQSVHPSLYPSHQVGAAQTQTVTPPAQTAQTIVCLGAFTMPPHMVAGPDAAIDVTITLASPTGTPYLDDIWFVDIETGALTWVTGAREHMWASHPTTDNPLPRVWTAQTAGGLLSTDLVPVSTMDHDFTPGDMYIYTVATGAESSKIQLDYHPRWHTHARRITS